MLTHPSTPSSSLLITTAHKRVKEVLQLHSASFISWFWFSGPFPAWCHPSCSAHSVNKNIFLALTILFFYLVSLVLIFRKLRPWLCYCTNLSAVPSHATDLSWGRRRAERTDAAWKRSTCLNTAGVCVCVSLRACSHIGLDLKRFSMSSSEDGFLIAGSQYTHSYPTQSADSNIKSTLTYHYSWFEFNEVDSTRIVTAECRRIMFLSVLVFTWELISAPTQSSHLDENNNECPRMNCLQLTLSDNSEMQQ